MIRPLLSLFVMPGYLLVLAFSAGHPVLWPLAASLLTGLIVIATSMVLLAGFFLLVGQFDEFFFIVSLAPFGSQIVFLIKLSFRLFSLFCLSLTSYDPRIILRQLFKWATTPYYRRVNAALDTLCNTCEEVFGPTSLITLGARYLALKIPYYEFPAYDVNIGRDETRKPHIYRFVGFLLFTRPLNILSDLIHIGPIGLLNQLVMRGSLQYCYSEAFPPRVRPFIRLVLGRSPQISHIDTIDKYFIAADWTNFSFVFTTGAWHCIYSKPSIFITVAGDVKLGQRISAARRSFLSRQNPCPVSQTGNTNINLPTHDYNRISHNAADLGTRTTRTLPQHRALNPIHAKVQQAVFNGSSSTLTKSNMTAASAIAAARILLGSEVLIGDTYAENVDIATVAFSNKAIITSIPPATKLYRKLTDALKIPLQYIPGIAGHDAAGTCRRAWIEKMSQLTEYGVVGMISPSIQEWHHNPNGIGYYHDMRDGVDPARLNRPCNRCQSHRCKVMQQAIDDKRVCHGNLATAIATFSSNRVDYLWMVNIEPNIKSTDVLYLMRKAGIENGYSASHIDWHVIENGNSTCTITEQTTQTILNKVISKFSDGGSYVQDLASVQAMFSPTFSGGCALRRTVLGRAGSSMLMELQVNHNGYGTSFVPDREANYLIPVPHPTLGFKHLRVEKKGLDRVVHTFRTTVSRTVEAARIQLRQANVTYSVSGTALTPRLELTATDAELLAIYLVSYSAIMDVVADAAAEKIQPIENITVKNGTIQDVSQSVTRTIINKILMNSAETNAQFGSQSSVRRWLSACEKDGRFMTLDEISQHAYEDVYGKDFAITTSLNVINSKWGSFMSSLPTPSGVLKALESITYTTWGAAFNVMDIFARSILIVGTCSYQSVGLILDSSYHISRVLGLNEAATRFKQVSNYMDTIHRPYGTIWADVVYAQEMPFQAASVYIVESLLNNFSPDPATLQLVRDELSIQLPVEGPMTQQESIDNQRRIDLKKTMDDIPYNRFITELKVYLTKVNSRVGRVTQMQSILSAASERVGPITPSGAKNVSQLKADAKDILNSLPETSDPAPVTSVFGLSNQVPETIPVPLPPVYSVVNNAIDSQVTIEDAFTNFRTIDIDEGQLNQPDTHRLLRRLAIVDGKISFQEIEETTERQIPGMSITTEDPVSLPRLDPGCVFIYAPTAHGGRTLSNVVAKAFSQVQDFPQCLQQFATDDQVTAWIASRSSQTDIAAVKKAILNSATRMNNPRLPHLLHIEGLAMGGKSAGVRSWISANDVVVVPSNELKKQWIESLGLLDPLARASVYTQHTALVQDCARFIIIDEAYTFEVPHLELLRRYPSAKGIITIGDGHQIRDVFSEEEGSTFNPSITRPFATAIAPVSFVPYDSLVTYLKVNRSFITSEIYYSGSSICRGLRYVISSDEIVFPSKKDLCINALQNSKQNLITRGIKNAITAHESQGSRSENTFVHDIEGQGVSPDFAFLSNPTRTAHFGVLITRARNSTIFVVHDKATARKIPYITSSDINGSQPMAHDIIFGGTSFDLIDPVTQPDITFDRFSDDIEPLTGTPMHTVDTSITIGSLISADNDEAYPLESIKQIDIPAKGAQIINTYNPAHATTLDESFMFRPANVNGSGLMNMQERATSPVTLTERHFTTAQKIVNIFFDRIIDPNLFFLIAQSERGAISRQGRSNVIKMATSTMDTRSDTVSFAFPKNEMAKKVMTIGKGLKTLSVTAMNQTQLLLFGDVCDILTHAWSRSLRSGISSPVGLTRGDISKILGSFQETWEIDLEKQDSSHSAVHVAVFVLMVEIVAKRLGMSELVAEIRSSRTIGDMGACMRISMGTGLGSGDAWTLIANKIMAFSVIVSRFELPQFVKIIQVGDDLTSSLKLRPKARPLCGSEGVTLKESLKIGTGRPEFTSFTSLNDHYSIATRIRGLLKIAYSPRTYSQHLSFRVECQQVEQQINVLGLFEYCIAHSNLHGSEPAFMEECIATAIKRSKMDFSDLPQKLQLHGADEKLCEVHSRDYGCFGYALSYCVGSNVAAVNALATYSRGVHISEAMEACTANEVRYVVMNKKWSQHKSPEEIVDLYMEMASNKPTMYLFSDHAASVTSISTRFVTMGGTHRYRIDLMSQEVEDDPM